MGESLSNFNQQEMIDFLGCWVPEEPRTGLSIEQIEAYAKERYSNLPNPASFPSWENLPVTEAEAKQRQQYIFRVHKLYEILNKQHYRQSIYFAARSIVPPGYTVTKVDSEE